MLAKQVRAEVERAELLRRILAGHQVPEVREPPLELRPLPEEAVEGAAVAGAREPQRDERQEEHEHEHRLEHEQDARHGDEADDAADHRQEPVGDLERAELPLHLRALEAVEERRRFERLELDLGRDGEDLLLRLAAGQLGEQALILALEHLRRGEEQHEAEEEQARDERVGELAVAGLGREERVEHRLGEEQLRGRAEPREHLQRGREGELARCRPPDERERVAHQARELARAPLHLRLLGGAAPAVVEHHRAGRTRVHRTDRVCLGRERPACPAGHVVPGTGQAVRDMSGCQAPGHDL